MENPVKKYRYKLYAGVKCRIGQSGRRVKQTMKWSMGLNVSDRLWQCNTQTAHGSKPEILSRIAQAPAALTRLKPVWIDKSISLSSKIGLMRSLFTSIFLYACESWTLTAETETFVVVVFSAVFCLFVCFFGHQALNGAVF